jgi:hypothetical protein
MKVGAAGSVAGTSVPSQKRIANGRSGNALVSSRRRLEGSENTPPNRNGRASRADRHLRGYCPSTGFRAVSSSFFEKAPSSRVAIRPFLPITNRNGSVSRWNASSWGK